MTKNKPHDTYTAPQSISLELRHIAMVSDLVQSTGLTRSQIVRMAIQEYYERHNPEENTDDLNSAH